MDLGDLGEVFTSTLADEIERETLREFSANSLGSHDTIRVTFFDFRHQTLLGGTQNSYAWSTAIVTGVDCDPGAFGAQVGSVSFVNGLSNVPRDEDGFVAVQIDPPEAGVKVYLHEAFTDGTTGGRYERRFPAAVTTSNGRANFSVPPNENGASVLTATVPARYASAEQRLTWAPGPNGTISPPIYNFDVSGFRGIVDKPVDFTYAIGNGGDLATCEVDWGEGNGWTPFTCPPRGLFGYSLTAARTISHTYINTGIVSPRFRFANSSGLTSETYAELSVTVPHHNTAPTIDDAAISAGHLTWTFRDPDVHDDFDCELRVEGPGHYLSRVWHRYPCSRSGDAPVDVSGASIALFRVTDGTASDSTMIGVDVNNAPELTAFAADPSPVAPGSPTTFSWSVSDPDGDPLTCGIDIDSDGIDDYTLSGSDCSPGGSQAHTYATAGSVQAILTVDDGRGGSAVATTTVKVEAPANLSPTARLTIRPGQQIEVGQQLDADASASSDADGTIVAYHFTDSRGNSHDGAATWTPPAFTSAGQPQVCVEVTDDGGATDQTCQTVQVVQPAPTGPDLVLAEYALPNIVPTLKNFSTWAIDEGSGFDLSATWTNLGDPVPDGTSFDFQLLRDGTAWKRHSIQMSNGQPVGNIERFNQLGKGLEPGSYAVSMVIDNQNTVAETDEGNNSASFSLTVNNLPPSADFTHGTQCLTATFTDASTDPGGSSDVTAWDWNFGDGTTSNTENPKHTYGSADTYNASLRVTDRSGAQSSRTTHAVTVAPCTGSLTVTISGLPERRERRRRRGGTKRVQRAPDRDRHAHRARPGLPTPSRRIRSRAAPTATPRARRARA